MKKIGNFINGDFLFSENSNHLEKKCPFTQEVIYKISDCILTDAVLAIQSANKSFLEWKKINQDEKIKLLSKIKESFLIRKVDVITSEARNLALPYVSCEDLFNQVYIGLIDDLQIQLVKNFKPQIQPAVDLENALSRDLSNIEFNPVGVISIFISKDFPHRQFLETVLPAILAGNTVVVKVSTLAAECGYVWGQLFKDLGIPAGVIQIIYSSDPLVADLIVSHPAIKAVSISSDLKKANQLLKKISSVASQGYKKIQIQSGSKNCAICLDGPDDKNVSDILKSFMLGQGQLIWNSARFFILEKNKAEWKEALLDYLSALKPSQDYLDSSLWTPILDLESINMYQSLRVQAGVDQGKLIQATTKSSHLTSNANKVLKIENYLNPIFTEDMSNCSLLQQDAISAPFFILSTVKYPFDIPKYANVSYYGHSASIWGDLAKAEKIAQQLEVGLVSYNKWSMYQTKSFSGVKQSSFGIADRQIYGTFFSNVKILT